MPAILPLNPEEGTIRWRPDSAVMEPLVVAAELARSESQSDEERLRTMGLYLGKVLGLARELVPRVDGNTSSATEAIRKKTGSCIAHTKVIAGVLAASGTPSNVVVGEYHFWDQVDGEEPWTLDGHSGMRAYGDGNRKWLPARPTRLPQLQQHVNYAGNAAIESYVGVDREKPGALWLMSPRGDDLVPKAEEISFPDALDLASTSSFHRSGSELRVPHVAAGKFIHAYLVNHEKGARQKREEAQIHARHVASTGTSYRSRR